MTLPHPAPAPNPLEDRRNKLLLVLSGIFVTNALLAELIGGKLFQVPTGIALSNGEAFKITLSCGIVLWPVVFIMTDIINEYFGRGGVKRLSVITAGLIAYAFVALWLAQLVPAAEFSGVDDGSFRRVFVQTQFIIVGSICAFLLAQLLDVTVFWWIRRRTGRRFLWLRATGSTVMSQLVDTYVVGMIGLYLPFALKQRWPDAFPNTTGVPLGIVMEAQTAGYGFKLVVAIAITPALYLVHIVIDKYLGQEGAQKMIEATALREQATEANGAL
ncbi:MAG: queuosine precursor transporter [Phycisphaerales bacterium]|nr:queuosine precursor transporter [Phycisphaerales bacterium]MCI0631589.1 queuosine precursor transporter [Phycisphaerales bacterium]MCI0674158.1 queuosine precursor transporter [Phycisphaerales bacterium]